MKTLKMIISAISMLLYVYFYIIMRESTGMYFPILLVASFSIILSIQNIFYRVIRMYFVHAEGKSYDNIYLKEYSVNKYLSFNGIHVLHRTNRGEEQYILHIKPNKKINYIAALALATICIISFEFTMFVALLPILPNLLILKLFEFDSKLERRI